MQMSSEPSTKIANERSFIRVSASSPRMSRTVTLRPSDFGGVWGRPKREDGQRQRGRGRDAQRQRGRLHPHEAHDEAGHDPADGAEHADRGNCFSGLAIWLKEIAFTRARVGL